MTSTLAIPEFDQIVADESLEYSLTPFLCLLGWWAVLDSFKRDEIKPSKYFKDWIYYISYSWLLSLLPAGFFCWFGAMFYPMNTNLVSLFGKMFVSFISFWKRWLLPKL